MNTSAQVGEQITEMVNLPLQLARLRQQKGHTIEYVASKLHLRVRVIELIENGAFDLLPEPVFVKGYLRAYAKLLGVSPDPFLELFNSQYDYDKKPEKALWQRQPVKHKAEYMVRWFTILFALGVMVAVGVWWHRNKDVQHPFVAKETAQKLTVPQNSAQLQMADLTKVQSILDPDPTMSLMERIDG